MLFNNKVTDKFLWKWWQILGAYGLESLKLCDRDEWM